MRHTTTTKEYVSLRINVTGTGGGGGVLDVFVSAKGWLEAMFMEFVASVAVGYPTVNYTPSIFMGMEEGALMPTAPIFITRIMLPSRGENRRFPGACYGD